MSRLFSPLSLRGTTFRNRAWLAPMCQYSCFEGDGVPTDWHLSHLGSRAAGGFGLVLTEAAAVSPEGRISPQDAGLWNDEQQVAWARIVSHVRDLGAAPGVQLAHAGRKASTFSPLGRGEGTVPAEQGGWTAVAPSAVAFPGFDTPHELTVEEISRVVDDFRGAAARADAAGFEVVEVHAAHGYLLHEFLSPLSNLRTDAYGGSFENRTRLVVEVVDAVREVWPESKPLLVRFSATDWTEGGWDTGETARLAGLLTSRGVDLIDVSSGGNVRADIPVGPGYQVPHARRVREEGKVPVAAVGLITDPVQAETLLVDGAADAVLLARAAIREPSWPLRAAHVLGVERADAPYPPQYTRGAWR